MAGVVGPITDLIDWWKRKVCVPCSNDYRCLGCRTPDWSYNGWAISAYSCVHYINNYLALDHTEYCAVINKFDIGCAISYKNSNPENIYCTAYSSGRAKAWFRCLSLTGILVSNPATGVLMSFSYMLRSRSLCDGTFPRQTVSYRVRRVLVWCWSLEFEEDQAH